MGEWVCVTNQYSINDYSEDETFVKFLPTFNFQSSMSIKIFFFSKYFLDPGFDGNHKRVAPLISAKDLPRLHQSFPKDYRDAKICSIFDHFKVLELISWVMCVLGLLLCRGSNTSMKQDFLRTIDI